MLRTALDARGFTIVEMTVVVGLLGITTAMFATVFSITINRSSEVQAQNITQTEVRVALNQLVSDLRNATTGTRAAPIISYGVSSIAFYSPDRRATGSTIGQVNLVKIKYWLTVNDLLLRQATPVSSYNSDGSPVDPGDTGPIQTIATVKAPLTGTPGDGGWASGEIFHYCVQSPPNMAIDPSNATSPELITWSCQAPTSAAQVKTIVIRASMSANSRSRQYSYGAVATLRWNAS